jgi:hypothetical protein
MDKGRRPGDESAPFFQSSFIVFITPYFFLVSVRSTFIAEDVV